MNEEGRVTMVRERLRAGWRWLSTPAEKPVLRDFVAIWFLVIQGAVRVVDGALFTVLPTRLLPGLLYGLLQVALGACLLATRAHRRRGAACGRWAAAVTAGLFLSLAWEMAPVNATSAFPALGIALVMMAEARYAVAD